MSHTFVGLPKKSNGKIEKTFLFESDRTTKVREVLWGDWLSVKRDLGDGWLEIEWGPTGPDPQLLYFPKSHTSDTRPLEIIFLDVGQGDGAVLITPEHDDGEAIIVIDAGESDNMYEFLAKRFRPYNARFQFHAAVITHPDKDHYQGFERIFENPNFGFDVVYHNGLAERPVSGTFEKLGGRSPPLTNGKRYITDLVTTKSEIRSLFGPSVDVGNFQFPQVMQAAVKNPSIHDYKMLSTSHGSKEDGKTWMPGFAPRDGRGYTIEVVGPVVETIDDRKQKLRVLGSYGETKNGHSVLLRLNFGGFRILFGGDLNDKAEKFLLTHYAKLERFPKAGTETYKSMIETAAKVFRADVMKVCHHGSEKVTDAFLETVFPAAYVISSGDREGHVHPRPDLLGRLGKKGRSRAPVILSTELQRSTREREDEKLVASLLRRIESQDTGLSDAEKMAFKEDIEILGHSNVLVYGTIYLKTDDTTLIVAFRIETGSEKKKWFTFQYELDENGQLQLIS